MGLGENRGKTIRVDTVCKKVYLVIVRRLESQKKKSDASVGVLAFGWMGERAHNTLAPPRVFKKEKKSFFFFKLNLRRRIHLVCIIDHIDGTT